MNLHGITRRALLVGTLATAFPAFGQSQKKVIRVVAPFQAGGGSDVLLRIIVKHLSERLSQPMIVDNKPGAAGAIAGLDVANSPADGMTLFFCSSTAMSGVAALNKTPAYDPSSAFSAINLIGYYSSVLFCHAQLPVNSVAELLTYGRARPSELKYGTGNAVARVAGAQLAQRGKVEMIEVPYKGEPALVSDLVAGRIQLTYASPSSLMPYVVSGKLKALATLMPERTKFAPTIPTMKESGLPGFISAGWAGMFGTKKFPLGLKERLADGIAAVMTRPEVIEVADQTQFFLASSSPNAMDQFLKEDIASWKKIVTDSGMELE